MWQVLALSLTVIGAVLMYLTNKHQGFISKAISSKWRLPSGMLLALAFGCWLQVYVFASALFLWLFITLNTLICIPLGSLILVQVKKKKETKEVPNA